eukprot:1357011-Rhodomonas_salina.3
MPTSLSRKLWRALIVRSASASLSTPLSSISFWLMLSALRPQHLLSASASAVAPSGPKPLCSRSKCVSCVFSTSMAPSCLPRASESMHWERSRKQFVNSLNQCECLSSVLPLRLRCESCVDAESTDSCLAIKIGSSFTDAKSSPSRAVQRASAANSGAAFCPLKLPGEKSTCASAVAHPEEIAATSPAIIASSFPSCHRTTILHSRNKLSVATMTAGEVVWAADAACSS